MTCKNCGGKLIGDGYEMPMHCETIDVPNVAPDSNPVFCNHTGVDLGPVLELTAEDARSVSDYKVYEARTLLEKSLASCLNATRRAASHGEVNIRIIPPDDGATPRYSAVAAELRKRNFRVIEPTTNIVTMLVGWA